MDSRILGLAFASFLLAACATTKPKPIVQQPLKLSGPSDILKHTCGEFGCDEAVKQRCGEKTAQILDKKFDDQSTDRRNQTTGVWVHTKKQLTHYRFRCVE